MKELGRGGPLRGGEETAGHMWPALTGRMVDAPEDAPGGGRLDGACTGLLGPCRGYRAWEGLARRGDGSVRGQGGRYRGVWDEGERGLAALTASVVRVLPDAGDVLMGGIGSRLEESRDGRRCGTIFTMTGGAALDRRCPYAFRIPGGLGPVVDERFPRADPAGAELLQLFSASTYSRGA